MVLNLSCMRHIKRCTVQYAQTKETTWDLTDDELDIFMGLLYLRGVTNAKNFPHNLLRSDVYMAVKHSARQCLEIA